MAINGSAAWRLSCHSLCNTSMDKPHADRAAARFKLAEYQHMQCAAYMYRHWSLHNMDVEVVRGNRAQCECREWEHRSLAGPPSVVARRTAGAVGRRHHSRWHVASTVPGGPKTPAIRRFLTPSLRRSISALASDSLHRRAIAPIATRPVVMCTDDGNVGLTTSKPFTLSAGRHHICRLRTRSQAPLSLVFRMASMPTCCLSSRRAPSSAPPAL
jgi:hypothetical protein